jgi:hypothetical protein
MGYLTHLLYVWSCYTEILMQIELLPLANWDRQCRPRWEGEILIHTPAAQQQNGEIESPCSRADVPVSLLLASSCICLGGIFQHVLVPQLHFRGHCAWICS